MHSRINPLTIHSVLAAACLKYVVLCEIYICHGPRPAHSLEAEIDTPKAHWNKRCDPVNPGKRGFIFLGEKKRIVMYDLAHSRCLVLVPSLE